MSNNYAANPKLAPAITRPGESKEHLGSRNATGLLPVIFQTSVNKQFLQTTLEQLLSSGSLQAISYYIGQKTKDTAAGDGYQNNSDSLSDLYQFVPSMVNKDNNNNITNALSYDDLLNSLTYNEVQSSNHNRVFNEKGYTLDLPINYDMFVNYHRYFWLVDFLPAAEIKPSSANPIVIDDIIGEIYYTTPTLNTNNTLTFENGMRVKFSPSIEDSFEQTVLGNTVFTTSVSGAVQTKVYVNKELKTVGTDYTLVGTTLTFTVAPVVTALIEVDHFYASGTLYDVNNTYIVDGVGDTSGIKLTLQLEANASKDYYGVRRWFNQTIYSGEVPSPWDPEGSILEDTPWDVREVRMPVREYTCEQRWSTDQSAWARSNLWMHEETAKAVCNFMNLDQKLYLIEEFRAVRPIIEYRANLEKFNFGLRHIAYVDHVFSTVSDPAVDIVGQSEWNLAAYTITNSWLPQGYEKGDRVKYVIGGQTTYWDCLATHTDSKDPTHYSNRSFWRQVTAMDLEDGDTILFLNASSTYNNKIFTVGGISVGSITLTETYNFTGIGATQILTGDKIVCKIGYNSVFLETYDGDIYSGSEWYWNGTAWVYGQQKDHRSEGALFQLYDVDLNKLNNTTIYPNNNFAGDPIFNFGKGVGAYDDALGFNPRYVDYGNTPGLSFDIGLGATKYTYNRLGIDSIVSLNDDISSTIEIPGYYYYKNNETGLYYNGWVEIRNQQPVKQSVRTVITESLRTAIVNLETDDTYLNDKFNFVLRNNNLQISEESTNNTKNRIVDINGTNPVLFMSKGKVYEIETYFSNTDLEFVNVDGTALSGVTRGAATNDVFNFDIDSSISVDVFRYRLVSDNTVTGLVYLNDDTSVRNLKVYVNGIETTNYTFANNTVTVFDNLVTDDVVTVEWYTDDIASAQGTFEPASTHLLNAQNRPLSEVSFADLLAHIRSQMESIPGFDGLFYGTNNYRNLPHVHEFGGTIRQQPYSTELLAQTLMDNDTNIFSSIRYIAQDYRKFKNQFLQKVAQLHRNLNIEVPVHELVDRALSDINLGKRYGTPYSNSNMAMYKDYTGIEYVFLSTDVKVFDLPVAINTYNDAANHIQVWLRDRDSVTNNVRWRPLIKGSDYTLANNQVTIVGPITYTVSNSATVHIRWYPQNSASFIPPSAAKLGLIRPHNPELRNDYSLSDTVTATDNVIVGHDGSIYARQGTELYDRTQVGFSIADAALWDLELRIYNNILSETDNVIDYKTIMPNANRSTPYNWSELTTALQSEFNKWKVRNGITTLDKSSYYNGSDPFTWNYNSVAPYIGGWRGLYTYFFNTDKPHLAPWEMFGYNKKPDWWDTNYSWTNAPKRAALIEALKRGHYNNPAETPKYSIDYAYTGYDWSANTLVTLAGVLNDPITANVVSTPSINNRQSGFVFGDIGPVESEWRRSSEYITSLFCALMRIRPLWTINNYFRSNNRQIKDNANYSNPMIIFNDFKELKNNTQPLFSYSPYENSIVESITVVSGGSGYVSAPAIEILGNFGTGATAVAYVSGGAISSVSVTDPGKSYYSKPAVTPSSGNAKLEAVLQNDALKYYAGLSNAVVEFALFNKTTIEDLELRFENLSVQPMIKVGGFINPNTQKFVLESSQNKGKVIVPEENYQNILHVGYPSFETFYSAITVSKTNNAYVVNGYDNSNNYFKYFLPKTGGKKKVIDIRSKQINRYLNFDTIALVKDYNSEFTSLQELFNFVIGYGEYLKSQGWNVEWDSSAIQLIDWAISANTNDVFVLNPNPTEISINEIGPGYFDNLNNRYDGVYNIIDKNGKQLLQNRVIVTREYLNTETPMTKIIAKNSEDEIRGLRLYKVNIEHLIVFENSTSFDDVLYKPELGQLHTRVIWKGSKTKNWNGRLHAPGYIVTDNTIINNFDTVAREIDLYYGPTNTVNNKQLSDAARFNIGYNKPNWANYTLLDDDTVFEFTKGSLKYKGTRFALDAFSRNTDLLGGINNIELYEEWAIRTADYGDLRNKNSIEFELTPELLKTSPQAVRFTAGEVYDEPGDTIIDIDTNSSLLVSGTPGNNFQTRPAKTYFYNTIADENTYANDLITAGLPLLTETDYRVINKDDFRLFPEKAKEQYVFSGAWQNIKQWDNKSSYKFKDQVIYQGKVWEMVDPDGASGLTKPNDPIAVSGTITLPVVPASGQTLILDGNTIAITKTSSSTTLNLINVIGTNNIGTTAVVPHNSTLILGSTSTGANAQTITFQNTVDNVVFQTIEVTFSNVVDPIIVGGASKALNIDGVTINFNDTTSSSTSITAFLALSSVLSSILSSARISAIEGLRTAYIAASSSTAWDTFITGYFTNPAGLDVTALLTEYATTPAYLAQLVTLIQNDVDVINSLAGTSYIAANVIAGSEVIDPADIATARTAMNSGPYVDDFSDWIKDNPTVTLTNSTVVATETTTAFVNYSLANIINKINAAGISNVTASNNANSLKLTKTTATPAVQFSLTTNPGTANAEVGFNSGTTKYNSVGTVVTTTPPLSITQVIQQINNAGIVGVTAQTYPLDTNRLQINSSNSVLYIGPGTANATIGLTTGVVPATSTITTISVTSDLTDIVQAVNAAGIVGVTASNSNNRLRIISTNSTLIIGNGTANATVGLTAQTYVAIQTTIDNIFDAIGSDGNPVFSEVVNDPNIFNIWVADNSEQTSANAGYAVFQTMDFDMYITRACAGVNDADDAQITIALANTTTQAHNLTKGDFVLIRGSNTVPSIDGIHEISEVDQNSQIKFYIDTYIDKEGNTGNVYPIRNVRFSNFAALQAALTDITNGMYRYNFAGYRLSNITHPIYAFVDSDDEGIPAVYKFDGIYSNNSGHTGIPGWVKVRQSIAQARNDLIKNVKIYDAERRTLITTLQVFDPAKGILPGFISAEIDFKTTADLANYNYSNAEGFMENKRAWGNDQVGQRWWDLTTAIYLDYEQGALDYQQANWGRLFTGSTVDIYEWTKSPVTPDQWLDLVANNTAIDGIITSGVPYSRVINGETVYQWTEELYYDVNTKSVKTGYYFWVKDKNTYTGMRKYNTYQLARIIENPLLADFSWCAASSNNGLLLANIQTYVDENTVVQVNNSYDSDSTLELCEYTIISEKDPDSYIPEYLHIKIRDSLAGFNNYSRTYSYTNYSSVTTYNQNDVVQEGLNFYISLTDNNLNNTPSLDITQSNWKRIYDYELPPDTPQNDIKVEMNQAVPDLRLHPYNRYGHLVRPVQSLYRDLVSARQNFVSTLNKIFSDMCAFNEFTNWENYFDDEFVEGTSTYDLNRYWKYVDYVRKEYSSSGVLIYTYDKTNVPDRTFENHYELTQATVGLGIQDPAFELGELALVKTVVHGDKINRPEVYSWDGEQWILEYKAKGTIEFSEEIWNQSKFGHGFDVVGFDTTGFDSDSSVVIAKMFDLLRERIFVGRHRNKYKKLWFQCLYQAVTDNTTDDFAFKTTYTKMKIERPLILDQKHYNEYTIRTIEEFYNDVKPFHTKLRNILDRNTHLDENDIEITEIDRNMEITLKFDDHSSRSWDGDLILSGGVFDSEPDNVDFSEFTTLDINLEYIYNGNTFIQPVLEGWGDELYPIDFTENIKITVQTNVSGASETGDTRTFYINYWDQYNVEESVAVVNSSKTTLSATIDENDTDIAVVNAAVLTVPVTENGVVWINNERIEYGAIVGNTLKYCVRGTRGTSATSHTIASVVSDASSSLRIPTPTNFYLYGNSLLPAYNDSGISLAAAGTGAEHSFIRSAGFGTL
jgi:hypothetical protein